MQFVSIQLQDLKQQFASKLTKYVFIKQFPQWNVYRLLLQISTKASIEYLAVKRRRWQWQPKTRKPSCWRLGCPGWRQNAADIWPFKRDTADTPHRIHGTGIFTKYVSGMIYTLSNVCFKCVYMYIRVLHMLSHASLQLYIISVVSLLFCGSPGRAGQRTSRRAGPEQNTWRPTRCTQMASSRSCFFVCLYNLCIFCFRYVLFVFVEKILFARCEHSQDLFGSVGQNSDIEMAWHGTVETNERTHTSPLQTWSLDGPWWTKRIHLSFCWENSAVFCFFGFDLVVDICMISFTQINKSKEMHPYMIAQVSGG